MSARWEKDSLCRMGALGTSASLGRAHGSACLSSTDRKEGRSCEPAGCSASEPIEFAGGECAACHAAAQSPTSCLTISYLLLPALQVPGLSGGQSVVHQPQAEAGMRGTRPDPQNGGMHALFQSRSTSPFYGSCLKCGAGGQPHAAWV